MRQLPFQYAVRNLGRSRVRLGASLLGSSLVVLLVLAAGGFVRGMQLSLTSHAGLHENVMILSTGSEEGVERSQIDAGVAGHAAASVPGLMPDGRLAIGKTLYFDDRDWTVVGRFRAPNTVMDAEIWLPVTDLQIATNRETTLSCVIVTLDTASFVDVDVFAKTRLDLEITAIPEQEYYASIAAFYAPIRVMVLVTAALIATGGILGGLNTMYAAFAARVREVGTLQSFGFTRAAILMSLTEESVFAAACGALIGVVAGLALIDGLAVRFSMGAFAIIIDSPVVLAGLLAGLVVGCIGAIPPAVRCLRLPITEALKSH